jgi:hypothetical protein
LLPKWLQKSQEAELRKQQLLGQIDVNVNKTNQMYQDDARQTYLNKMLGGQAVSDNLSRMGLTSSGFGVGQHAQNEMAYGSNLAGLQRGRTDALSNLDMSRTNTESEHSQQLQNINTNYMGNVANLDKYVQDASIRAGEQAYNRSVDEQRYKDQLNQQKIQNNISWSQINNSKQPKQDPNFGADGRYIGPPTAKNPYGANNPQTRAALKEFGNFGNGYQPKGINDGKTQSAVVSTNVKIGTIAGPNAVGSTGIPISDQSIWKTNDNKYWYWDGTLDKYVDVTKALNKFFTGRN